jgi:hypothetical protein
MSGRGAGLVLVQNGRPSDHAARDDDDALSAT